MIKMGVPVATPIKYSYIIKSIAGMLNTKKAIDEFLIKFKEFSSLKKVVLLGSGREVIYYCLLELSKISRRREVIIPAFICPSVPNAIRKAGLVPVLCDIEIPGYGIDYRSLDKVLNDNTIAIIQTHLFGYPQKIKKYSNIFIIEDCAQSLGAEINGKKAGTYGDFSIYSFGISKVLSLCGGGALGINNKDYISLFDFEYENKLYLMKQFEIFLKIFILNILIRSKYLGILDYIWKKKYQRKSELEDFSISPFYSIRAALGTYLLNDFDEITLKRKNFCNFYKNQLKNFDNIIIPKEIDNTEAVYLRYPILIKDIKIKEKIIKNLKRKAINVSEMYDKINLKKILDVSEKKVEIPNTEYASDKMVNLPCHNFLTIRDAELIMETFEKCLK